MNKQPRYLKWDYDNDTLTEYERQGECNMCGQCCMALIKYRVAGKWTGTKAAMGDNTDRKGVWSELNTGRMRRFAGLPTVEKQGDHICPAFRFNGCTHHAKKSLKMGGQLALCAAWPVVPEHVEAFDECSYTFVQINQWKISELAKPLDEAAKS